MRVEDWDQAKSSADTLSYERAAAYLRQDRQDLLVDAPDVAGHKDLVLWHIRNDRFEG
jgi:hypothetical protein